MTGEYRMASSTALGASSGCSASSAHWVGMIAEHLDRGRELVARRIGARHQQCRREREQFVVAQSVAVDLGAHHVREQVVG